MKYFLELLEIARASGVLTWNTERQSHEAKRDTTNRFFDQVEKCQPFIFMPKNKEPVELWSEEAVLYGNMPLLSAPFPVFSVEIFGAAVCVPRTHDDVKVTIYCIVCVEQKPNVWEYFCLSELEGAKRVFAFSDLGSVIEEILKRLNSEKAGTEKVRERIKIGVGDRKRTHTIRRVIHVAPKKIIESLASAKTIDWSHRWPSRGHWRELPGKLGKDRDGNYCVKDWTWVTESVKGPKEAPLISKTRIVDV